MRTRLIISVVAALASLLLVAPTFAQAEPVCGSTEQQWLGSFHGDFVPDLAGGTLPMSIEVTLDAAGELRVTTELEGTASSGGAVILDRLRWNIPAPPESMILWTEFHAEYQGVTCSGGVVTAFTGFAIDHFYSGHSFLWGDFALTR